ncbi:MAG: hypothetical protein ACYDBH_16860 [Acidobacteriaceae bacterium]
MSLIFSSPDTLAQIAQMLRIYHRLPFAAEGVIPGIIVEDVLAQARGMRRLGKYDFVDVISKEDRVGLQVKSSKAASPLTWQRAKVIRAAEKREASKVYPEAAQALGAEILDYINQHIIKDFDVHDIDKIGYARLVITNREAFYFETKLVDREHPILFDPKRFTWRWALDRQASKEKRGSLSAYDDEGVKWFSWHTENQLHFNNEKAWWPQPGDPHRVDFSLTEKKIDPLALKKWLDLQDGA